jgi:cytosine/uracil/thiamine/allantoin permease
MVATAFGVGLLLALTTSAGIAGERVTHGAFVAGVLANASATFAAILALLPTMRWRLVTFADPSEPRMDRRRLHALFLLIPQVLGAAAGIVLVHIFLRREMQGNLPWLSEGPGQFVNDLVAVSGLLALIWACANGLDARVLVLAIIGVTLYRLTSPMWHLDHAPGGFHTSVQELVVAELGAAALALGLFSTALDRTAR